MGMSSAFGDGQVFRVPAVSHDEINCGLTPNHWFCPKTMIIKNSRILLTGASSGIGRALALQLAEEGANLVLTARREHLLTELKEEIQRHQASKSVKVLCIPGDITDLAVQKRCLEAACEHLGGLDALVNNAGVGATALIEATSDELARRLMEVNYFSALSLARQAVPLLRESLVKKPTRAPIIVFLSSVVGFRGVPHYGAYSAAKFAITGLSESLRAELSGDGIDVLLVSPGTTETEFFDSLLESSSKPNMPKHNMVSPESVAKKIVTAMKRRKKRIIPYFQAQILYYLNRLSPNLTDRVMSWYR